MPQFLREVPRWRHDDVGRFRVVHHQPPHPRPRQRRRLELIPFHFHPMLQTLRMQQIQRLCHPNPQGRRYVHRNRHIFPPVHRLYHRQPEPPRQPNPRNAARRLIMRMHQIKLPPKLRSLVQNRRLNLLRRPCHRGLINLQPLKGRHRHHRRVIRIKPRAKHHHGMPQLLQLALLRLD